MKLNSSWRVRLTQILLGSVIVLALVAPRGTHAQGRDERGHDLKGWDGKAPENPPVHLGTDWSHRHLVFSTPKSLTERIQLSSNPRYVQQWIRRNAEKQGDRGEWRWRRAPENPKRLHGDWSMDMGVGATVGAGMYPAKYSFDATSATCAVDSIGNALPSPDFVVYTTGLAGSATQPTIAALTNLYSSCPHDPIVNVPWPNWYWAFNTGTGTVVTSPVLSGDGSQVAFIQNTAGAATLVILRWKAYDNSFTSVTTPTGETPSNYYNSGAGCTAPCQTTIAFSTATGGPITTDTQSSPFSDYAHDVLYVGDKGGYLHKFTGIFNGTPTEVESTTGANIWPAYVSFTNLRSPVFDDGVNQVFVCDHGGVLYRVNATTGSDSCQLGHGGCVFTAKLGDSAFDDAPLLDSSTGNVYVFARGDMLGGGSPSPLQRAGVFQLTTNFPYNARPGFGATEVIVSSDNTLPGSAFYVGDFDNAYYNSSDGTGNMYVCSTNGGLTALWQIPVTAGALGTPVPGPTLTTANVACSPITEFFNSNDTSGGLHPSGTDYMFLSVVNSSVTGAPVNCTAGGGCIMSYDITTTAGWGSGKTTSATAAEAGGTSGIVVDNSSGVVGASQVYFTPLADQLCTTSGGTGGCAIQASQSGLN
jgi:hypothetical protein